MIPEKLQIRAGGRNGAGGAENPPLIGERVLLGERGWAAGGGGMAAYLAEGCRLYLLFVLVLAFTGKALTWRTFRRNLGDLLPAWGSLALVGALAVMGAEALLAGLLMAGEEPAYGATAAALSLFLAFTAVVLKALVDRRQVRCSCFGAPGHVISRWDLARNALLIAACVVYLAQAPRAASAVDRYDPRLTVLAGLVTLLTLQLGRRIGPGVGRRS